MQNNAPPTNITNAPTTEAENSPPATGDAVRVARWAKNPNGGDDCTGRGLARCCQQLPGNKF
jgi:hypothetical protein